MSSGLAPTDRRILREGIISNFFETISEMQVTELDALMDNVFHTSSILYRGQLYNHSKLLGKKPMAFTTIEKVDGESLDTWLDCYEGLEMEMASMSAMLTRMFSKCNSHADICMVLPYFLKRFIPETAIENMAVADDATVQYIPDSMLIEIENRNATAMAEVKARLMMDDVFGRA